jgi:hypothetical protein
VKIHLNVNEVLVSGYVGMRRNAEALYNGRKPRFAEKKVGELWGFHIESAHAECAVSKALGVYWGFGVNTFHAPDIMNTKLEVRWSSRTDVKVRPDDDGIVVSVTGACPDYEIKGWLYASAAKQEQWKCKVEPICYFVPHIELTPFETLKSIINDGLMES